MKLWFRRLMYGRNGLDTLANVCLVVAFMIYIIAAIFDLRWITLLFFALVIYAYFRCFSKNVYKRRNENAAFVDFFVLRKKMFQERKDWKYLRCKNCKAYLRVPRNKGTLDVKCPKCGQTFRVKG